MFLMLTIATAAAPKGTGELAIALELLSFIGKPGGWLVALYLAWKYVLKDVVAMHVSLLENAKSSTASAERAAASSEASNQSAEATVAMAKEIVTIAKDSIESARRE